MEGKMASNYDVALKAEAKKVTRCFHHYDTDQIALLYSRQGNPSRDALNRGVFFYIHPEIPNVAFSKRFDAAREALRRQEAV
jgi:hypothetical protein